MMKKVLRYSTALVILFFSACKEDDGLSQTSFMESPRFYVNASINGLPISYKAGENNYQMYTDYTVQDSVLHMFGVLATDSLNLRNALRLNIRGAELIDGRSYPQAGNVFQSGAIALYDPSGHTALPGHFDYHFTADSVNGHIPLVWHTASSSYYGDSCRLIGLNTDSTPNFTVEMQSAGPLSCTPSVKHTIKTGQDSKAQVHITRNSNSQLRAEAQARIGRIKSVSWQIDGVNVGTGETMQYSTVGFSVGFQVKAQIEFEDGGLEIIEKVVLPGGSACDINIDYTKQKHRVYNPHNLKTIELQYFDANGKEYSSAYPLSQGNFVIESISDYNDSNSSLKHQRFSFSGNAILKSADGSTLEINNIFGSFAVAHP